jgi:hypothetical protein
MKVSNSGPSARRRGLRKYLILPKFQLLVIGINLCVIFTMSIIIWVGTRNALSDLQPVAGLSGIEANFYKNYLDYQISTFQQSLLISLVVGAAFSAFLTLVITHRISGPMVRMKNYFRTLGEGNQPVKPLEFRDGDYFRDLPPLINDAIDRLETKHDHEHGLTHKKAA